MKTVVLTLLVLSLVGIMIYLLFMRGAFAGIGASPPTAAPNDPTRTNIGGSIIGGLKSFIDGHGARKDQVAADILSTYGVPRGTATTIANDLGKLDLARPIENEVGDLTKKFLSIF